MATSTASEHVVAEGSTFIWHEVYGPSADAAIKFYTTALGWGVEKMDMGEMGSYHMLVANGKPVCGVLGTAEMPGMENVPPHWATYIAVDDVDARIKSCEEAGGKLLHGPMDIPTVGRMALLQDPQGATFWLFKPDPM